MVVSMGYVYAAGMGCQTRPMGRGPANLIRREYGKPSAALAESTPGMLRQVPFPEHALNVLVLAQVLDNDPAVLSTERSTPVVAGMIGIPDQRLLKVIPSDLHIGHRRGCSVAAKEPVLAGGFNVIVHYLVSTPEALPSTVEAAAAVVRLIAFPNPCEAPDVGDRRIDDRHIGCRSQIDSMRGFIIWRPVISSVQPYAIKYDLVDSRCPGELYQRALYAAHAFRSSNLQANEPIVVRVVLEGERIRHVQPVWRAGRSASDVYLGHRVLRRRAGIRRTASQGSESCVAWSQPHSGWRQRTDRGCLYRDPVPVVARLSRPGAGRVERGARL